jgi:hypothetical protein
MQNDMSNADGLGTGPALELTERQLTAALATYAEGYLAETDIWRLLQAARPGEIPEPMRPAYERRLDALRDLQAAAFRLTGAAYQL